MLLIKPEKIICSHELNIIESKTNIKLIIYQVLKLKNNVILRSLLTKYFHLLKPQIIINFTINKID